MQRRPLKASCGTWCPTIGVEPPASLQQAATVLSAFGYDGIELAGFLDHATVERFPDTASRERLRAELQALELEPVLLAPSPPATLAGGVAWALSDDPDVLAVHRGWWQDYLDFAAVLGAGRLRIEPGIRGPLSYDVDRERVRERVVEMFRWLADRAAQAGCTAVWEMETNQPFAKPSEVVALLDDVDHPNCLLLYDVGHFHASAVVGHGQVQPRETLAGGQLELLRRLRGRIGHVHLCDTDGDIARDLFASKLGFGKGLLDFDALLPALVDAYDGEWWGVDAIPLGAEVWGDCWEGLSFVRDVVGAHVAVAQAPAGAQ